VFVEARATESRPDRPRSAARPGDALQVVVPLRAGTSNPFAERHPWTAKTASGRATANSSKRASDASHPSDTGRAFTASGGA